MSHARTDTDAFNIHIPEPERARLDALAQSTGRSNDDLITEALKHYLDDEQQQIAEIREGIADAGRVYSEADVAEEMRHIVADARAQRATAG